MAFGALAAPAMADGTGGRTAGSNGGGGGGGGVGGVGGVGTSGVAESGSPGLSDGTGGTGGSSNNARPGGAGGVAGTAANPTGGDGTVGGSTAIVDNGTGGGGGGGGGDGFVGASFTGVAGPITGGKGGDGGIGGDAGGGGGGGAGAVLSGSGSTASSSDITGGEGGNGGKGASTFGGGRGGSSGYGGGGGSGLVDTGVNFSNAFSITGGKGGNSTVNGIGLRAGGAGAGGAGVKGTSLTLTNSGAIQGGAGGIVTGTTSVGAGGVGIVGSDLQIVNSGLVAGGLSGDGVTLASAITFTGGVNSLEIWSTSNITGNVVAFSAADTFRLGGATDQTFNASQIGAAYQGFGLFEKIGPSTWTLTGASSAVTPWVIKQGTLSASQDASLGDVRGSVTLDGGTLQTTNSFSTNRALSLTSNNGSVDVTGGNTLVWNGVVDGPGSLSKTGAGTLTLAGINTYAGATNINVGTLLAGSANTLSQSSAVTVASGATLDLNGFSQATAGLNNAGLVSFGSRTAPGTALTVTGNYTSNGGTIAFNEALGGDASPTDRMRVTGDTSGVTSVRVANKGGVGAPTAEGIRIIEVGGASDGQFSLLGDYVTKDRKQAVIGGAYAYTLEKNGVSTPSDGNWYLRSQIIPTKPVDPGIPEGPRYAPGVPLYETYPQVLQALNGLPTLQQRVGNRYWSGSGIDWAAGSVSNGAGQTAGTGFWGRVEGGHSRLMAFSTSSTSYDVDIFKLQAGIDGQLYESEAGSLIGGLTLHYGNASANVRSLFGDGRISTNGYGLGGTLTWYSANGFYVDGQAQTTWFDSTLSSQLAGRRLVSGNDGFGYALSVETGQRIALTPNWTLTPQAQLIYSKVSFDSFTDPFGAQVSLDHADSLRGRLGLALDYEQAWRAQDGTKSRSHVYGIANLYNEFSNGTRVDVAGTGFANRNDRLWGGIGLGGSFNWKDDRFSLYGEAAANTSLGDFGDSYTLSGTAGLRVKF